MAALDPSAIPQLDFHPDGAAPRATLKLIRERIDSLDDDSEDEDYDDNIDAIRARLGITEEDDEDGDSEESDSEDEKNGGPSDPSRSKKAIVEKLKKALKGEEDMDLDDAPNGLANGIKSDKGKGKASDVLGLEDDSDEESEDDEAEEFVLCTLDPEKHYQQPLDITVNENEKVYFKVSGTHTIYLTGNYVIEPEAHNHDDEDSSDEEMDYDLSPDEDELDDEDEEDDVLDSIKDPRITEVDSEEEEAPKLVKAAKSKGKNKRPADDSDDEQAVTLDDLISKSMKPEPAANGEQHLSKKERKKLKKNDGQATAVETPAKKDESKKDQKDTPNSAKGDKKVQFAKNLEQGPTGSPLAANGKNGVKKEESPKTGPKIVQGVTVDDKKLGKGPAAKKGDRIGMRYIGKFAKDGKVFDSNKKGKPFTFKLGVGEVIKGWDIGVVGMTVGGERRITIPSKLAYGNKPPPGIPANAELIFDIKMMSVN
ncbi:hypothetical protein BU16DRAFT_386257 [Lophium mytilinum]|uniref:FK506-binding protein n=1 Tax=Lophium mytilinum TaxID=390894 RepID=A0A6A6QTM3_9PEZI|nr:hypothetical protein BU16DRAFT_386257 [Lophium mytilinum]